MVILSYRACAKCSSIVQCCFDPPVLQLWYDNNSRRSYQIRSYAERSGMQGDHGCLKLEKRFHWNKHLCLLTEPHGHGLLHVLAGGKRMPFPNSHIRFCETALYYYRFAPRPKDYSWYSEVRIRLPNPKAFGSNLAEILVRP